MLRKAALVMAVMTLAGCEKIERSPDFKQSLNARPVSIENSNRFKVERVQVFLDGLAYNNERGIYLITDTETGQEFVGISGVGISELGMHSSGKISLADER